MDGAEDLLQVRVSDAPLDHLLHRIWVDHLVSEGPLRHVGPASQQEDTQLAPTHTQTHTITHTFLPLRDVEHVMWVGPVQNSSVDGPQAAEDPEEGALAAAVGAGDQHVHPLVHLRRAAATAGGASFTQPDTEPAPNLPPPAGLFRWCLARFKMESEIELQNQNKLNQNRRNKQLWSPLALDTLQLDSAHQRTCS